MGKNNQTEEKDIKSDFLKRTLIEPVSKLEPIFSDEKQSAETKQYLAISYQYLKYCHNYSRYMDDKVQLFSIPPIEHDCEAYAAAGYAPILCRTSESSVSFFTPANGWLEILAPDDLSIRQGYEMVYYYSDGHYTRAWGDSILSKHGNTISGATPVIRTDRADHPYIVEQYGKITKLYIRPLQHDKVLPIPFLREQSTWYSSPNVPSYNGDYFCPTFQSFEQKLLRERNKVILSNIEFFLKSTSSLKPTSSDEKFDKEQLNLLADFDGLFKLVLQYKPNSNMVKNLFCNLSNNTSDIEAVWKLSRMIFDKEAEVDIKTMVNFIKALAIDSALVIAELCQGYIQTPLYEIQNKIPYFRSFIEADEIIECGLNRLDDSVYMQLNVLFFGLVTPRERYNLIQNKPHLFSNTICNSKFIQSLSEQKEAGAITCIQIILYSPKPQDTLKKFLASQYSLSKKSLLTYILKNLSEKSLKNIKSKLGRSELFNRHFKASASIFFQHRAKVDVDTLSQEICEYSQSSTISESFLGTFIEEIENSKIAKRLAPLEPDFAPRKI